MNKMRNYNKTDNDAKKSKKKKKNKQKSKWIQYMDWMVFSWNFYKKQNCFVTADFLVRQSNNSIYEVNVIGKKAALAFIINSVLDGYSYHAIVVPKHKSFTFTTKSTLLTLLPLSSFFYT